MTIKDIKKICEESCFEYFGLRADDMEYQIGDICQCSHQLYQDPWYDDDGELVYPRVDDKESPYYGCYDAGELDGTCCIGFDPENPRSISDAMEEMRAYTGRNTHLYIIAGDSAQGGNDYGEIIIEDAEVLGRL